MNQMFHRIKLILPAAALAVCSCGETSPGGGAGTFDTVQVAASTATDRLESDVVTGNTCTTGTTSGGTIQSDSVNVTVTSTTVPNSKVPAKTVFIDSYTVSYTPNVGASSPGSIPPALPDFTQSLIGRTLAPGGSLTVPVPVMADSHKQFLLQVRGYPLCSGVIWSYFVTITFSGVEENGTRASFYATMNVAVADRQ